MTEARTSRDASRTTVKAVVVCGSASAPSRTLILARAILAAVGSQVEAEAHLVDIAEIGSDLGRALGRSQLSPAAEKALQLVESADILIAATPVYRGSYTGHFKHLFDLVGQDSLIDTPVILAATGGSDKHCLIIEHQLRPLFGFLQAYTVPVGVYASHSDFADGEVRSELVLARIATAARQAARLVRTHATDAARPSVPLSASLSARALEPSN
jgi:FMN reductase